MKKRKWMLALMFILMSATIVACSSSSKDTSQNTVAASNNRDVTMPKEKPTMVGKVKEIIGNEVTVFKGELSQNEDLPKETPQGQSENQGNQGPKPGFKVNFTEETETFMIPVGIPIVGQRASEVALDVIEKDMIIKIWKKNNQISFVQVAGGNGSIGERQKSDSNEDRRGTGGPSGMGGPPPGM